MLRRRNRTASPCVFAAVMPKMDAMGLLYDDATTLKLVTLRRLLAETPAHLIFDVHSHLDEIEHALLEAPRAVAVVVDDQGILQGTLRLADLPGHDRTGGAETAMTRETPQLVPEHDPESALRLMHASGTDRLLVVEANGTLLGVLTDDDLRRAA